jgi:hypothetical protein
VASPTERIRQAAERAGPGTLAGMAKRPDELHDPVVVEIEDEFSRLPAVERTRLTDEWIDSLRTNEPVELSVSGAEMVAAARDEASW